MTQTFTDLNYHVTFGTKGRRSSIPEDVRDDLRKYMGGIVKGLECHPVEINAVEDHAHLLVRLPPKVALSDLMRAVKAGSSKWMNDNVARNREFDWQDGFGAFSVSHSLMPRVGEYVKNQAEHHRKKSFRDEFILLLKRLITTSAICPASASGSVAPAGAWRIF
jgi:REP element-mobilizing transposase RayT